MRKFLIPAMLAGTLALGGCAAYGNPLGGVLGGVLGGNDDYGSNGQYGGNYGTANLSEFERAAWNACGQEASRYGRVAIDRVDQSSRDTVRVDGRIDVRDRDRDQFSCIFRNDGRIADFRVY